MYHVGENLKPVMVQLLASSSYHKMPKAPDSFFLSWASKWLYAWVAPHAKE